MIGDLLANSYMYLLGAVVVGFIGYNIWNGAKEANEDAQFVFVKLSELFERRPESYVVRSLSTPNSSEIGGVTFESSSAVTSVYSGPSELFIANRDKDEFFSIPWDRIDSIDDSDQTRLTLLVNSPTGKPAHIDIPWSDDLTLEGWERHKNLKG